MGFHIPLSGLRAAVTRQDVTANNLANVATPGFRASRVDPGGSWEFSVSRSTEAGTLQITGNRLDVAIEGEGFFQIRAANGAQLFTRSGAFVRDAEGRMTLPGGERLEPPVHLPADAKQITVSEDGVVTAVMGSGESRIVGRIELANFANPGGLEAISGNLFRATPASGEPRIGSPGATNNRLLPGTVELSNVSIAAETVNLIQSRSSFQLNVQAFRAQDEALGTLLDLTSE